VPVLDDLVAAGFHVRTIADLRFRRLRYSAAVPILIGWLPRVDSAVVKEEIVQCLGVSYAKPAAARVLVEEFRRADEAASPGLRWAIGNALDVVGDDSVAPEMVAIALDRAYGPSREMLVVALGNLDDPRVVPALIDLLGDEEVCGHALMALGRLAPLIARAPVEKLLAHSTGWVRREARKALDAIDRAAARLH
jgi:HEAT repeat protein